MKVLLTGARGQLGQELLLSCPADCELLGLGSDELDVTDSQAVLQRVEQEAPALLINCAAYTAVDGAESEPDLAVAVNAVGAGNLARAAQRAGARMIQLSTDFVFDGSAQTPYAPLTEPRPLGVYGHSKLAGERRVQEILPLRSTIVRTSWLYSAHGNNFVKTMLRLMSERPEVSIVADQQGSPTSAAGLADALWRFASLEDVHGVYHWSDAGQCSWYDFACAICQLGHELGLLQAQPQLRAIPTREYPTPAERPVFSVLDTSSTAELLQFSPQPWRQQLQTMLEQLMEQRIE